MSYNYDIKMAGVDYIFSKNLQYKYITFAITFPNSIFAPNIFCLRSLA